MINTPGPAQTDCRSSDDSGSNLTEKTSTEGLVLSFEYSVAKK